MWLDASMPLEEGAGRERGELGASHFPIQGTGKPFPQVLTYFAWQKPPPSFTKGGKMSKHSTAGCGNREPIALHGSQGQFGNTTVVLITDSLQHEGKPGWGSFSLILQHPSSAAPSSPSAWLHKHPQNEILSTRAAEGKPQMRGESDLQSRQRDRAQVTIKTFCQNFFPPTENKVFNQTLSG